MQHFSQKIPQPPTNKKLPRFSKEDFFNIFRIFFRDIRTLVHQPAALIIILGISFIPSLYAWVNIYANWDPYGKTDNLKVAVVSNDTGCRTAGVRFNLGESIVDNLHTNHSIDWQFVSEAQAQKGVRSGRYYAAVIIPEDFSEDMVTFITSRSDQPAIEYYSNEKKNAIASKITSTGINTLQSAINEQFVNTISETILDVLNLTDVAIGEKGNSIVLHLTESLEETDKDLDNFSTAVDLLIETAGAAQSLTDAAQELLPNLDDTVGQNITALENLRLLGQTSETASQALGDMIGRNVSLIIDRCESLGDSLESAANNAQNAANAGAGAFDRVSASAGSAADTVAQLRGFLSSHEQDLLALAKRLEDVVASLDAIREHLPLPLNDVSSPSGLEEKLKAAIDETISLLDQLHGTLTGISRDASSAAQSLRSAGTLPEAQLDALRSDVAALRADTDALRNQYQTETAPLISDTLSQFYTCLDSLSNLLLVTNQNLPLLGNVLTGVNDSLGHSITALTESKSLIANAQTDIETLLEDLHSVEQDAQLAKLMDIIRNEPETLAAFIASPVSLDTTHIYPIENYGSAMTPFYSILAIWVGCLVMCTILQTEVREDEKLKNLHPTTSYFGRYLLFAAIGVLQALIICLGDLYILKIQCLHPALFLLTGIVAGLVYALIMYTLTSAFKNVGKAIGVIILVVQVAGSGGTFPTEVLPKFFQVVSPYLPFTFCIDAMRECIGGLYGHVYAENLIRMALIYVPLSLIISITLRRPVSWLMTYFEEQADRTGLL